MSWTLEKLTGPDCSTVAGAETWQPDSPGTFEPIWILLYDCNQKKKLLLFYIFKRKRGFKKLYYCFRRQASGHITATKAWVDGAADKGRLFKIDTH